LSRRDEYRAGDDQVFGLHFGSQNGRRPDIITIVTTPSGENTRPAQMAV
jgi:hypothetical protein